jgi:protein-S-isoprenylcysteine O-methyltransferase Ste14
MRWTWGNVPVPVQHVLGLISGAVLQFLFNKQLFGSRWIGLAIGFPLIALGVALSVWSVLEAGETRTATPARLLTSGPYSFSRNPMYVGWTLVHLGIGFAANSPWILLLLPPVAVITHFVDVAREESYLEKRFGNEYLEYKGRVRRYC